MNDGGRERASLGVEVWESSQMWRVQRSVVRSIAWLGVGVESSRRLEQSTPPAETTLADNREGKQDEKPEGERKRRKAQSTAKGD